MSTCHRLSASSVMQRQSGLDINPSPDGRGFKIEDLKFFVEPLSYPPDDRMPKADTAATL